MPRPPRFSRAVISDDDMNLLKFLWKWRTSTTAALSTKFYPHKTPRRGYERLRTLEEAGVIESRSDSRARKFIWVMTKRGFETVKPHLPPLREDGFKSATPGHDLLSAAMMLGDWMVSPQKGVRLISEQQLLRYEKPIVRVEQPYGTSHRTDGYWFYPEKGYLIALEVQLTHQRQEFYNHVQSFYALQKNSHIRHVIWLVGPPTMKETIRRQLGSSVDQNRHHFVPFRAFFEKGWRAEIQDGQMAGTPVKRLLSGGLPESQENDTTSHRLLLDVRKSPHVAKNEVFYEPLDAWI